VTALVAALALAGAVSIGCTTDKRDRGGVADERPNKNVSVKKWRNPMEAGGTDGESFASDGKHGFGMYDGYSGSGAGTTGDWDDDEHGKRVAHHNKDGGRAARATS